MLKYGIPGSVLFAREIMQNRQYCIVSGIAFWKCTPLLRTPYFCMYSNMAFLEVYSFGREIMQNRQYCIVKNEVYSSRIALLD